MKTVREPRLGVNIDHIATLRQTRGEIYPSPVVAAGVCLENGADQITIHLREDRRHIQDTDVEAIRLVTMKYGKPLNLEMGLSQEIIEVALASAPEWLCVVPERRMELTTEGGLNIADGALRGRLIKVCELVRKHLSNTKISLFIDAKESTIQHLSSLKGLHDAVEIHTGDYSRDFLNNNSTEMYLTQYARAWEVAKKNQLGFHAGHGLTSESLNNLLEQALFEEYNIGHWIIAESVFKGIGKVVNDLKTQIKHVCQKQPSE